MPKKKTPTGYIIEEDDREVGTLLAAGAKRNREVYEQFKRIAAERGLKTSEAVEEALRLWTLSKTIRDIDPDALIAAINFVNYMREISIKELLALGKLFTSEFFKVQMGIAQEVAAQTAQTAPPEQETKPPNPDEILKQQLKFQMLNTMIPLYMGVIQQMLKAFGNVNIPTQNILPTQTQTTQNKTKKPIVEE